MTCRPSKVMRGLCLRGADGHSGNAFEPYDGFGEANETAMIAIGLESELPAGRRRVLSLWAPEGCLLLLFDATTIS